VSCLERRIIDQYIDATELFDRFLDYRQALGTFGKIARQQEAYAASCLNPMGGLFGILVFVKVGNGNVRAFTGKGNRDSSSDPAVSARDEGDLPNKALVSYIAFLSAIRAQGIAWIGM